MNRSMYECGCTIGQSCAECRPQPMPRTEATPMAEIDAEELGRCLLLLDELEFDLPWSQLEALGVVEDAARAHLASLRAPKGELEEALAAFAAGKDNFEAAWRPGAQRMTLRWTTDWETHEGAYFGQTPHAVSGDGSDYHTALAAALSRARGEGT